MIKLEFTYELIKPVVINHTQDITSLTFKAPTVEQKQHAAKLKQSVLSALMSQAEKNKPSAESKPKQNDTNELTEEDGEGIVSLMYSMPNIDIIQVLSTFESLITTKDSCLMNNNQPLSSTVFKTLLSIDSDKMLGAYIANFILASR